VELIIRYRGAYYPSQALPKWVIYGNALALPALLYCEFSVLLAPLSFRPSLPQKNLFIFHDVRRGADILAAYLGGKLVYEYAMGVQRQGAGLDIKKQMAKEK
jgi:hypothetical protein